MPHSHLPVLRWIAVIALCSLLVLCLAWELWLAPLRPGGSWLALKAAPLALPLGGFLSGRRYTFQWTSLLALGYFAEGVVRCYAESGAGRSLAATEIVLSLTLFAATVAYSRAAVSPAASARE
jgi:uncharacterized membrane protein